MSETIGDRPFPRAPLVGAGILVLVTILAAAGVRATGIGASRVPDAAAVTMRDFHFVDRTDGGIDVIDVRDNRVVDTVAPGTNGFIRGTLRGLARERKREGVGAAAPFRLVSWSDGRLTLEDPATGRRIDLEAFGPTNSGAFAHILTAGGKAS
jgi:putative photosynthetic complex assembly protein